ncbi:MAG: alpha-glucosidase [Chitinophagales bacterium]|nr:alpha-glucosidase [Chitinophagales bacterium]
MAAWYQTTTIYQIYPRSYKDSNGDGIGDLQGIIQQLDYIRDMGFETIWLSPFYTSPQVDVGYDIADYRNIAPEYGTMADAEQLIEEVHRRGMKIVFDMVMNHTSDQHPWFRESCTSRDNPKADWYIWRDQPNNWKSILGPKGWHYCEARNQYYYASFLPFQPDLNYRNPEVKKEMFDTCRFWLQKGVDGFRLDIFNCIIKDKDFRDNPFSLLHPIPSEEYPGGNFQIRKYSLNQEENFVLAQELRQVVDEFQPDRMLLGEVFGGHENVKQYLGKKQDGLHLVFLFDILFFKFKASYFRKKIAEFEHHYPAPNIPTIVFSNHDQLRSMRRIGNDMQKAKLLAMLQSTVRAVPTFYYGEEVGMTNGYIPIKEGVDAMCKTFGWVPQFIADRLPVAINRDVCRTPMQWNTQKNAGFSTADKTWLPVNKELDNRNVAQQLQQPDSLLHTYRSLLAIRKKEKALHQGDIEIINAGNDQILAYVRTFEKEKLLVFLNFSAKKITVQVKQPVQELVFALQNVEFSPHTYILSGYNGIILKI